MARWRQVKNEDGTYSYVEVGSDTGSPESFAGAIFVQPGVHTRSIVDGSLLTSRAAMAEHNRRNNVVHESEFGTAKERKAFFDRKARERADIANNTTHTFYGQKNARERKQALIEAVKRHERS